MQDAHEASFISLFRRKFFTSGRLPHLASPASSSASVLTSASIRSCVLAMGANSRFYRVTS